MSKSEQTIRVVKAHELMEETGRTPGAVRQVAVDSSIGATKIWAGVVRSPPGLWSVPHHHGEAESLGYVLSGQGRIYFGERYEEFIEFEAGDFVFVPAHMRHVEGNTSETEPLVFIVARSPDHIVVNLPALDSDVHASALARAQR
jgi:uncharacterized RmlC-like cupin family protein